jgi:hypothetical protein
MANRLEIDKVRRRLSRLHLGGLNVRHILPDSQLFFDVFAVKVEKMRATLSLAHFGQLGLAASCSAMVSVRSKVAPQD